MAEEEKLLMRLKNRKRNAIDEAIEVYTPYLSTVLYNMLGNRLPKEDIEEILSDVFVTLWKNADTIDLEKGTLRAYLAAVARNFALKKLNKQRDYTSLDEIELPDEAAVLENKKKLEAHSQLQQWPVQIKLVPINAPYFDDADLLIAADCTAYAYANFHQDFIKGKITLIGCPKLDSVDYSEKLTEIIRQNNIKSVTIVRMEVPCCGGIQNAAINAMKASGKFLPWQVYTISTDGRILA